MGSQDEMLFLLKHFLRVIEASKGPNSTDRLIKSQGLIAKCFEHCASTVFLLRETNLPEIEVKFKDFGTVFVTLRAALESFLTFGDIFYLPKSDAEFEYKLNIWLLSGLIDRQNFFPDENLTQENKQVIIQDQVKIEEYKKKIVTNPFFLKLTEGQKNGVLKGYWKDSGWVQMGVNIRLDKIRLNAIYSYLCAQAHSGGLSGMQYNHLVVSNEDPQSEVFIEPTILVILANMIEFFCELFPKSKEEHEQNSEGIELVKACLEIGREPLEIFSAAGPGPNPVGDTPKIQEVMEGHTNAVKEI